MTKPVMIESEGKTRWRLYSTDIVTYDKTIGKVTISTGGWLTPTTIKHINAVSDRWFNNLFRVAKEKGSLLVKIGDGKFLRYEGESVEIML